MTLKNSQKARRKIKPIKANREANRLPSAPETPCDETVAMAAAAIAKYRRMSGLGEEEALADMLADLMHLCDRDARLGNFNNCLARAYHHYEEEVRGDDL